MSNEIDIWAKLVELYPELTDADFNPQTGSIGLRNDADGFGTYIEKWEHPTLERPADADLGITLKPVVIDVVAEVVEAPVIEPPAPVIEEPTA